MFTMNAMVARFYLMLSVLLTHTLILFAISIVYSMVGELGCTYRDRSVLREITVARIDKDNLTLLLFTFHVKVNCARAHKTLSYEKRGDGGVTKFAGVF